jgi:hypothetical protein
VVRLLEALPPDAAGQDAVDDVLHSLSGIRSEGHELEELLTLWARDATLRTGRPDCLMRR